METVKSKECTKCHKIYPETKDYFKTYFRAGKQHLTAQCKFCYNDYNKKYRKEHPEVFLKSGKKYDNSPKGIYKKLKQSIRGHKVKISEKSFVEWYLSQPRKCYYCGLREEDMHKVKDAYNNKVNRLTIDRTDSSKGYEEGNMVLCCLRCNHIKGDFFTQSEMEKIGKIYIARKWENAL